MTRATAVNCPQPPLPGPQSRNSRSGRRKSSQSRPKTSPAAPPARPTAWPPAPQRLKMSLGRAAPPAASIGAGPAGLCSKRAASVSGGVRRTGNACAGVGVFGMMVERFSAVEGAAAHPLLLRTAAQGRPGRPGESHKSCQGGGGFGGGHECDAQLAVKCTSETHPVDGGQIFLTSAAHAHLAVIAQERKTAGRTA